MPYTSQISADYTIDVPVPLCEELGIKPGDTLIWKAKGDSIVIRWRPAIKLEDIAGIASWEPDEDIDAVIYDH